MTGGIHPLIEASGIEHWQADCARCGGELSKRLIEEGKLTWAMSLSQPMWVCSECGNKRCPKATWHELPCGHSNEPGQPGSAYQIVVSTQESRLAAFENFMQELKEEEETE